MTSGESMRLGWSSTLRVCRVLPFLTAGGFCGTKLQPSAHFGAQAPTVRVMPCHKGLTPTCSRNASHSNMHFSSAPQTPYCSGHSIRIADRIVQVSHALLK